MSVDGSKWVYMRVYEAIIIVYECIWKRRDIFEAIWRYMKVYDRIWM